MLISFGVVHFLHCYIEIIATEIQTSTKLFFATATTSSHYQTNGAFSSILMYTYETLINWSMSVFSITGDSTDFCCFIEH